MNETNSTDDRNDSSSLIDEPSTSGAILKRNLNLPKVAIVVSVFAILISGYSLAKSQNSSASPSGSLDQAMEFEDADLFKSPVDLEGFIDQVEESVVSIECSGWGTGFVLDTPVETKGFESVIVTNHHVIEDCIGAHNEIVVLTGADQSGRPLVKLLRWDAENDLAIIEIDEYLPGLAQAEYFAERGWWTMAIGSPVDSDFDEPKVLYNSTTFGHISYVLGEYWNYTSATINGGNSGGPLVNSRGELIGINTLSGASTEGGVWNIAVDSAILCKKIYIDCTS